MREEVGRAIGLSARKVQVRTRYVENTYSFNGALVDLVPGKCAVRQDARTLTDESV